MKRYTSLCISLTDSKDCRASTLRGVITKYMQIAEVIYMGTGLCRNTNDTVFLFRTDTNQRIGKDVNKAFAQVRQNKIQSTALQHIIATALTFGATVDQISKLDV